MFGFLSPPKIPEPVRPDDFTREERDRHRSIAAHGDPMRDTRDQTAIDRLLTNSVREITGPTGAFTLAQRTHADDNVARNIADYMGQSSQLEEERRFRSEDRLHELESQRRRDLDEYEQLVQSHQAAEEVARKNWQSGLLRAGAGLLSVAAPGIGTAVSAGVGLLSNRNAEPPPEDRRAQVGFGAMSDDARGNMMFNAFDRMNRDDGGLSNLAIPGFDEFMEEDRDYQGRPIDSSRTSFLGY